MGRKVFEINLFPGTEYDQLLNDIGQFPDVAGKWIPAETIDGPRSNGFGHAAFLIKRLEKNKKIWGYCTVTDDEKLDLKRFIILIKRSTEPVDDAIQKIIDFTIEDYSDKMEIEIIDSCYLHGHYDWMFTVTAEDMKNVKRFTHLLSKEYQLWINEILVLQNIFPVKKCGIFNPNMNEIKDLF